MAIRVGTAPDSYRVWFPSDERQTPSTRFLNDVVAPDSAAIELGRSAPHRLQSSLSFNPEYWWFRGFEYLADKFAVDVQMLLDGWLAPTQAS
jgi:hypothetical protein